MKKILTAALALLFAATAFSQGYPSPTYNNLTVVGTFTLTGGLPLTSLAVEAANTVVANITAVSASPTAVALPSCSTANSALKYTSASGFSCGTTYALTSGTLAQFASTTSAQLAGVISDETGTGAAVFASGSTINPASTGATTPGSGAFTSLSASGTVSGTGFTNLLSSYAPLASPALTGTPTAPTATTGTNNAQIATTAFVQSAAGAARLLGVQVFTASGTYTPTTGATKTIVNVQAPGGGSSGTSTTSSSQVSLASPGSGGAYAQILWASPTSQTVTIGTVGSAGAVGGAGGTGGTTSVGSIVSCPGGPGGGAPSLGGAPAILGPGGAPAACTVSGATTLYSIPGGRGPISIAISTSVVVSTAGGITPLCTFNYGSGGGYGCGGTAMSIIASTSGTAGIAGGPGIVIFYDYQ